MPHNDIHITIDHDRATVTAKREIHSMSMGLTLGDAGPVTTPAVSKVSMVPVPVEVKPRRKRKA